MKTKQLRAGWPQAAGRTQRKIRRRQVVRSRSDRSFSRMCSSTGPHRARKLAAGSNRSRCGDQEAASRDGLGCRGTGPHARLCDDHAIARTKLRRGPIETREAELVTSGEMNDVEAAETASGGTADSASVSGADLCSNRRRRSRTSKSANRRLRLSKCSDARELGARGEASGVGRSDGRSASQCRSCTNWTQTQQRAIPGVLTPVPVAVAVVVRVPRRGRIVPRVAVPPPVLVVRAARARPRWRGAVPRPGRARPPR